MRQVLNLIVLLFLSSVAVSHELVLDHDFPDPSVVKGNDGWYYAYATQGVTEERSPRQMNIQMARSRDLRTWQHIGDALPMKPVWAKTTQQFWAPHVHHAYNRYYMYYSAEPDTRDGFCLAVAVSRSPHGPFVDSGRPLGCGPSFANIDPMIFDDPQTGRPLMYWGSAFEPIRVRPLSTSLLSFAPNTRTLPLLYPSKGVETPPFTRLLEGAWVVQNGRYFYLFVSGENCCEGSNPQYAVLVARSENSTGPFRWRNDDPHDSVVIKAEAPFLATGHNAFIDDQNGQLWTFYHGIDFRQKRLMNPLSKNRVLRRVLLRSRVDFEDGWPVAR